MTSTNDSSTAPASSEGGAGLLDGATDEATQKKPNRRLRILLVVLLLAGLAAIGEYTGVTRNLDVNAIRARVVDAGPWGYLVYTAFFSVGILLQVPGWVFVTAASLVYGKVLGFFAAHFGAWLAVLVTFVLIRNVGGKPLGAIEKPWIKKILDRLDQRPIRTVMILRVFVMVSPPVNYALALSNLRFRDYAIGSFFGLIPSVLFVILVIDKIRSFF